MNANLSATCITVTIVRRPNHTTERDCQRFRVVHLNAENTHKSTWQRADLV